MEVHSCSHLCHNTPGSYTCSCKDGYQLQADKLHCIGKNTFHGVSLVWFITGVKFWPSQLENRFRLRNFLKKMSKREQNSQGHCIDIFYS